MIEIVTASSPIISQGVLDLELDIGIVVVPNSYPDLIVRKIGMSEISLWQCASSKQIASSESVLIYNPEYHQLHVMLQKCKAMLKCHKD